MNLQSESPERLSLHIWNAVKMPPTFLQWRFRRRAVTPAESRIADQSSSLIIHVFDSTNTSSESSFSGLQTQRWLFSGYIFLLKKFPPSNEKKNKKTLMIKLWMLPVRFCARVCVLWWKETKFLINLVRYFWETSSDAEQSWKMC